MPSIFKLKPSIKVNNTTHATLRSNSSATKITRSISSSNPFGSIQKATDKTLPINEKFAHHVENNSTLRAMLDDFNPHKTLAQQINKLAEQIKTEMDSSLLHEEIQKFSNLFKGITDPKAASNIYAALGGTHPSGKKNLEYAKENAPKLYEDLKNHSTFKDYFPTQVVDVSKETLEFLKKQAEKDQLHDFFSKQDKTTQEIAELFLSNKNIPEKIYTEAQICRTLLILTHTETACLANFLGGTKYESDPRFIETFRFAGRNHANLPFHDEHVEHQSPAPKM